MTPPLFRERLARWLVDVTLEAAGGQGRGRPSEPRVDSAERPPARSNGERGLRSGRRRNPGNHEGAA